MSRGPAPQPSPEDVSGAVLGRGSRVRGRIRGEGDLRIEGQVEGGIAISGELSIDEGGAVQGDVEAGSVSVGGTLTGDITARGGVAIRAGAKVSGKMGGAEVTIDEGASVNGRIDADVDMPAELQPRR